MPLYLARMPVGASSSSPISVRDRHRGRRATPHWHAEGVAVTCVERLCPNLTLVLVLVLVLALALALVAVST
jgi:uncharacterized protein (DUF2062 family)